MKFPSNIFLKTNLTTDYTVDNMYVRRSVKKFSFIGKTFLNQQMMMVNRINMLLYTHICIFVHFYDHRRLHVFENNVLRSYILFRSKCKHKYKMFLKFIYTQHSFHKLKRNKLCETYV